MNLDVSSGPGLNLQEVNQRHAVEAEDETEINAGAGTAAAGH